MRVGWVGYTSFNVFPSSLKFAMNLRVNLIQEYQNSPYSSKFNNSQKPEFEGFSQGSRRVLDELLARLRNISYENVEGEQIVNIHIFDDASGQRLSAKPIGAGTKFTIDILMEEPGEQVDGYGIRFFFKSLVGVGTEEFNLDDPISRMFYDRIMTLIKRRYDGVRLTNGENEIVDWFKIIAAKAITSKNSYTEHAIENDRNLLNLIREREYEEKLVEDLWIKSINSSGW